MKALIVLLAMSQFPIAGPGFDITDPLDHSIFDFGQYGPYGPRSPHNRHPSTSEIDDPVETDVTVYSKMNVAVRVTSPNYPGKEVWIEPHRSHTFRRQGDLTLNIQPQGCSMITRTVSGPGRTLMIYYNAPGHYDTQVN